MKTDPIKRRTFLTAGPAAAVIAAGGTKAVSGTAAQSAGDEGFQYQVVRSDEEWRQMFSKEEYVILRKGSTELPNTSPLVNETRDGTYSCKGCDLTLYDSVWKVPLDIGYVFFSHSRPDTMLTSIDGSPPDGMGDDDGPGAMMEVHCRRCGSHHGHIVYAREKLVHCINGTSIKFDAATA